MPRSGNVQSARPQWYDRNPTQEAVGDITRISEDSALTTQWSYTVASGHKAVVSGATVGITGEVAATSTTPADYVRSEIALTPSGDSAQAILSAELNSQSYGAGDRQVAAMGGEIFLAAGDAIAGRRLFQGDNGGAGIVAVRSAAAITEFDE